METATTPEQRQQGLMFREYLDAQAGMLFVFEYDAPYAFWMKNTKMSLDIIWIDSEWRVVDSTTALPCEDDPCPSYYPRADARYVLEINA